MDKMINKILDFKNLKKGWCYGEGISIKDNIIAQAIILYKIFLRHGFDQTDTFPGLDGEIRITIYSDKNYFEFTINSFDEISFVYEIDEDMILYEHGLTFCDAQLYASNLKGIITAQTGKLSNSSYLE